MFSLTNPPEPMQFRLSSVARHLKLASSALVRAAKKAGFVFAHSDSLFEGKELKQILFKHGLEKKQVEVMLADDLFHVGVTIADLGDDFSPLDQVDIGSTRFHFDPTRPITNPYLDEEALEHTLETNSVSANSLYNSLADDTHNLGALEVLQIAIHRDPIKRAERYQALAEEEELESRLCDKRREVNEAVEHRRKAARWRMMARDLRFLVEEVGEAEAVKRSLPRLAETQRIRLQRKLMILDQVWLPIVPEMAAVDPIVLRAKAMKSIEALATRICKEEEQAIEEFARLLMDGIKAFLAQQAKHQAAFDRVMAYHTSWPVLASLHPRFMNEWQEIAIKLGTHTGMRLDRRARWNPRDPGTQAALQLLKFVAHLRAARNHFPKRLRPAADRTRESRDNAKLLAEVARLEGFSTRSAAKWWAVAQEFLLRSYPELEREGRFRCMVTAKSHLKSSGKVRARILEKMRGKFLSLAGRHAPVRRDVVTKRTNRQTEKRDTWDEEAALASLNAKNSGWV